MQNTFNLEGKTALVTGGSQGLGKEIARIFAYHGAKIIITSRDEEKLKASLADILSHTSAAGAYLVADLSKRADIERLAREAQQKWNGIDILVNNAGTNTLQSISEVTDEVYDAVVELNQRAVMSLTRAVVSGMKERRWGRIINVSSVMAFAPLENRTAYAASKSAVVGMTRAWATDLGQYGITVNCIVPGPFLTDLPARVLSEEQKRRFTDRTSLRRWGKPSEIAGPVLMLASEAGSYITGECLRIDGGYLSS